MRKLFFFLMFASISAIGQNYTFTAPHLTMHVGDLVPPCPIIVYDQSSGDSVGEGNNLFSGNTHDTCTTTATTTSPVGTYPVTINPGSLVPRSGGTITRINSSIDVIPADDNGAKLNDTVPYPSGITDGPLFPMLNVTSNSICNMVADNGVTDNTPCLQNLLTYGGLRAKAGTIVDTSGTTVTYSNAVNSSMAFSTVPVGTNILINGASYTVATVATKSLTLTASAGTQTNVLLSVPTTVNTATTNVEGCNNMVTATNGTSFSGLTGDVLIAGVNYVIASSSVQDTTHLCTTTPLPTLIGAPFYVGNYTGEGVNRSPIYLYFPGGIYWIHGAVHVFGDYWTFTGDGPENTILRLAPNSPQFSVGSTPVPMFNIQSISGNDNFSEIIQNLQIRVGQGNPNAQAIEWPNNNQGEIRNVTIWSEDSIAESGVYLGQAWAGATLLKDVGIYGFQTGIAATSPGNEYSITADEITLEGQQAQGILANMSTSFQHVLSDNTVSAFISNTRGVGVLIDSELLNTNSSATGITIANGNQLYFKNVSCTGYSTCEIDNGSPRTTLPAEGWTGTAQTILDSGSPAGSLAIADTETPVASDPAVSTWTMLGTDPSTWCATIQAVTSSSTIYLPPGTYTLTSGTISCSIPKSVNHIIMWGSKFSTLSLSTTVTFTVSDPSPTPLIIDGCMQSVCTFMHQGSRTLVLSNATIGYQASQGAGNVYFEDVQASTIAANNSAYGPTFLSDQLVTGRQLDIETGNQGGKDQTQYPKIQCQGAQLWILGYKTEKDSPSLIATGGCQANLFGFWYYNLENAPPASAPMVLTDSSLFATGYNDWNTAGYGPPNWVIETRNGNTPPPLAMPNSGGSFGQALNMFYSYGAAPH